MSILTDVLKSGASSVAGAVPEKLGIDPATAQNFIDSTLPGDHAGAAPADQEQQGTAPVDQAEAAPADQDQPVVEAGAEAAPAAEEEGMIEKVTAMLGGTQGITEKAKHLLDRDGDGNPLNDVTNMIGKFFAKD